MKYFLIPFLLLLSTISLFSETQITEINPTTATKPTTIITLLENPLSPNRIISNRFILVVERDIQNFSFNKTLIPKGTRVVCKQEKNILSPDGFIITGSCNKLIFPNKKSISFKGDIYDQMGRFGVFVKRNSNIPSGTRLVLRLKEDLDLRNYVKQ